VSFPAQVAKKLFNIFAMVLRDALFPGNAADKLTAIATGRPPTNSVCFNNVDVVAPFCQVQGS